MLELLSVCQAKLKCGAPFLVIRKKNDFRKHKYDISQKNSQFSCIEMYTTISVKWAEDHFNVSLM